ncbi:MAG: radical SAM family heme chaperone HemW [Syntrophomonadaceae bacterium]|nr:radical SAM family heme chaperone HemW [Syntrophomonadaceae bacterium]
MLPQGMYIHIPFCQSKCQYCDFYSQPLSEPQWLEDYISGLVVEIQQRALCCDEREVATLYIGGGTPSLLSSGQAERIIDAVNEYFCLDSHAEITMEANPGSLDSIKISDYRQAGVNRISLGAQSFDDEELKMLGRRHRHSEIFTAVEELLKKGINNYNLDLMYGLPGQKVSKWEENLRQAFELNPVHLSCYLLQLDEQTPMGQRVKSGKITLLDEDDEADMYEMTIDMCAQAGLNQYELSNFSRPDYNCRHNLLYWHSYEYIGIGAGAVSYIGDRRFKNSSDWQAYITNLKQKKLPPIEQLEQMKAADKLADIMIMGLRLCEGVNLQQTSDRCAVDIGEHFKRAIKYGMDREWLEIKSGNLCMTRRAYFISNQVLCLFTA